MTGLPPADLPITDVSYEQSPPAPADATGDFQAVSDFMDANRPHLGISNTDTLCHIIYRHEQQIAALLASLNGGGG